MGEDRRHTYSRAQFLDSVIFIASVTNRCANAFRPNVFSNLSNHSAKRQGRGTGRAYHLAIFTNGCPLPSLSAKILYPVLCQSMMSFEPRMNDASCARSRVGIDGGFYGRFGQT